MEPKFYYNTVTEAIDILRQKGYSLDFNLDENRIACHIGNFGPEDFEIREVHRYEGASDPGDEATVYGIESSSGARGILVTGYGASSEDISPELMKKLHYHRK
jgi:hypothetical protein